MQEPKTREEIINEQIKINEEAEKYIDDTGDIEGGLNWRDAAFDEINENN